MNMIQAMERALQTEYGIEIVPEKSINMAMQTFYRIKKQYPEDFDQLSARALSDTMLILWSPNHDGT